MGDSVMALLKEEFQDDDLSSKRRAAERLDLVARALGTDRARSELLPWLLANLEQEDEVLHTFARKCGELLPLVGGADAVSNLVPVLEALLNVEETFVRDAAVQAMLKVLAVVKADAAKALLVETTLRLSKQENFTARISACAVSGHVMQLGLSSADLASLVDMFSILCKDETPMVRRAASTAVPDVVKALPAETILEVLIPIFIKLSGEPQESVALNWVSNIGVLAKTLRPEQSAQHLIASVEQFCSARSWRVRFSVAQCFKDLPLGFDAKTVQSVLLPLYCELLRDPEGEVRSAASEHVEVVCEAVGSDAFTSGAIPVITGLIEMDQQRAVRLNLAKAIVSDRVVKTVQGNAAKEHLLPLWEQLLRNANSLCAPEVRLIILEGIDRIIGVLGGASVAQSWTSLLKDLFETSRRHTGGQNDMSMNANMNGMGGGEDIEYPQWRLRVAVIHALGCLAGTGDSGVDRLIVETWASSLSDEVFEVRLTAAKLLGQFAKGDSPVGPNKVATLFIPRLIEFFKQSKQKYHQRVIFVHAFRYLLETDSGLAEPLFGFFEKCLEDKVANVRLTAARVLGEVTNEAVYEKFSRLLGTLSQDHDPDVSEAARSCAQRHST